MKILMVSPQFRPIVGGYERSAERLAIALAQRGHQVTVLTCHSDLASPTREMLQGVAVHRCQFSITRGQSAISSALTLLLALARTGSRCDVWHVHAVGHHAALTILLAKLMRKPTLLKLTSTGSRGIAPKLRQRRMPRVLALLHRSVNAVAAPTSRAASEALAFGFNASKVLALGNGVNLSEFMPRAPNAREACLRTLQLPRTRCAVSVGRVVAPKAIGDLLAAWSLALPRFRDQWSLLIVGDGPDRAALQHRASQLGLGNSVRWLGERKDVADLLGCSDLFVQSSLVEGLSNAMLEAMASGLACIVTDVSGAKECVHDTGAGRVVPIGNCDAFADAMVELANNSVMRERCSKSARRTAEARFGIDRVAASYEDAYARLSGR